MPSYGQFCPVAKAVEVLGERWTLLIVRELMQGSRRFSDLQRGLSRMAPSLLSKRLKDMESKGLLLRVRSRSKKGYEYELSPAGNDLAPLVLELARWGLTWVRSTMERNDLDIDLLMLDIQRSVKRDLLPQARVVVKIEFRDLHKHAHWWLILEREAVDVCTSDPGLDVSVTVRTTVKDLARYWMGEVDWRTTKREHRIQLQGGAGILRELPRWLGRSSVASLNPQYREA
ncbi:MAG: helix-turn-helix transcriptional regulator [Proteobacteria bacterium]|nr:helix-turn-helix transcriptional regulator [Pseudomonadota bacterium]